MDKSTAELLLARAGEAGGREILVALCREAALRDFDRACAVVFAVSLLERRVDRVEIRDRIMARYGFPMRTAYRCIDDALVHFCQPHRPNGKPNGDATDSINPTEDNP